MVPWRMQVGVIIKQLLGVIDRVGFACDVNGTAVRGRYLELDPPRRLLISWGFDGSDDLPPGASTLEVRLLPERDGTRVGIRHRLLLADRLHAHASG